MSFLMETEGSFPLFHPIFRCSTPLLHHFSALLKQHHPPRHSPRAHCTAIC